MRQNTKTKSLKGGTVVLIFIQPNVRPARLLLQNSNRLARIYGDEIKFVKIFRQENRPLAENLGVTSSPTVFFIKTGLENRGKAEWRN